MNTTTNGVPDVIERIKERRRLTDEKSAGPIHVNRISSIGHPCERFQVYARTKPELRERPNDFLLGVFLDGHLHEQGFIDEIRDAGFDVLEAQRSIGDAELKISGHWEGRIVDRASGDSILFEFKSLNSFEWEKLNSVEDMRKSRRAWVQGYPAQFTLYLHFQREIAKDAAKLDPRFGDLLARGVYDRGLFVLKNKQTGELKSFVHEYAEDDVVLLLERAGFINANVEAGTLPDRIQYDTGSICDRCAFRTECLPDQDFGDGVEFVNDIELGELLVEREDLKEGRKRFEELDKAIKRRLKNVPHAIVEAGDDVSFEIKGSSVSRVAYSVEASFYWKASIRKISP